MLDAYKDWHQKEMLTLHDAIPGTYVLPTSSIFRHSFREGDSFIKHEINHGHFFVAPFLSLFLPLFLYISAAGGLFRLVDSYSFWDLMSLSKVENN